MNNIEMIGYALIGMGLGSAIIWSAEGLILALRSGQPPADPAKIFLFIGTFSWSIFILIKIFGNT